MKKEYLVLVRTTEVYPIKANSEQEAKDIVFKGLQENGLKPNAPVEIEVIDTEATVSEETLREAGQEEAKTE